MASFRNQSGRCSTRCCSTGLGGASNPVQSLLALVFLFPGTVSIAEDAITRIALGSCADQKKRHIIWDAIVEQEPELFVFLGDNIYGDTEDMDEMRKKYAQLAAKPGFIKLRESCPIIAVWDDHDYGVNDGGEEYPMKVESEAVFHEFFETPEDAPVRSYPGTYDVRWFGNLENGTRLQIVMLDTRYFRSQLVELAERSSHGPYDRNRDPEATVLGAAQWVWLEEQLREPADLRIVLTSIQLIPQDHHWELWENIPHERERFFNLLGETETGPIILASGDRHMGEFSMLGANDPLSPGFPVYEMTTSGLTNAGGGRSGEPNRHRVSKTNFQSRNFGLMEIDWTKRSVLMELRDVEGAVVDTFSVDFGKSQ